MLRGRQCRSRDRSGGYERLTVEGEFDRGAHPFVIERLRIHAQKERHGFGTGAGDDISIVSSGFRCSRHDSDGHVDSSAGDGLAHRLGV